MSEQVIQLGFPPNRINILTSTLDVEFAECYSRRLDGILEQVAVSFISREDLKKNKLAVGRPQDLADLDKLE